ncbi:MAG: hypothetical protein KDA96_18895 [Planctomycetaceae bacterium]|nr:hypothetical protein [Planctomycetaceae bacterium]
MTSRPATTTSQRSPAGNQEPMPAPPLPVDAISPAPQRGAWWTLVGAMATLGFILWTVWAFVIPRLSGEVVAVTAPFEIRPLSTANDAVIMVTPAGEDVALGPDALLSAKDLYTFRGYYSDGDPVLDLNLHREAAERFRKAVRTHNADGRFGIIVNGKLIAVCSDINFSDQRIHVNLSPLPAPDAEEAFARLTQ